MGRLKISYSNGLFLGLLTVLLMMIEIVWLALLSFFYPASKIDQAYDFDYRTYLNETNKTNKYGEH